MKAAIMGYGTIGSGVYEVLDKNCKSVEKKAGEPIEVKYILDLREFPGSPVEKLVIHDVEQIVNDPEIGIVVETMGGTKPAYEFVKRCLLAGKHVVTSNKALVAAHGTELIRIAAEKNISFLFEASVGGGIPIIRPLVESLGGEEILEISGILNGTTNYILTKMNEEGWSFEEALKRAQELGYAERNPEADIEGNDTCRKIAILTAVATGKEVNYEEIPTQGITKITSMDSSYAAHMGAAIKLFGTSVNKDGKIYLEVAPVLVDAKDPLYAVTDVFNGILVVGNMLGASMFYGSGAGKLPTASAVVGDMVSAVRFGDEPEKIGWSSEKLEVHPAAELSRKYFARFEGSERAKKEAVAAAFGDVKFVTLEGTDEFAVLTGEMTGEEFDAAAARSVDCARRSRPDYDPDMVPDAMPVSDDDRALLSGMRGNESRPGTPFRASGTKLSVPSGGAVYGIGSCVGCGFLDPVFCHGKQEIPTGVG